MSTTLATAQHGGVQAMLTEEDGVYRLSVAAADGGAAFMPLGTGDSVLAVAEVMRSVVVKEEAVTRPRVPWYPLFIAGFTAYSAFMMARIVGAA